MNDMRPAEVFPPGEFLRDELEARGWTQDEFAKIVGRPAKAVNEIIQGKKRITPETAMDLAAALGTSAQLWMNLDAAYQLHKAGPATERALRDKRIAREARLREEYPVRELIKRGWIEDSDNFEVLETRVLSFYGISSVDEEPNIAHAAKKTDCSTNLSQIQLAWLCRVKQLATSFTTPVYSEKKLREAIRSLSALTVEPEEIRHVPYILSRCGVRFVVVEPMKGSKIDGVCFWINGGATPVIGMTLRLDRIDNFWFVLRHEIEHVLRRDGQDQPVVDEANDDGGLTSSAGEDAEKQANSAAEDFCVPSEEMEDFIARVHPIYSRRKILGFSRIIHRHPGLVVGQIHNRTKQYQLLREYLAKVRSIVTQSSLTDGYGVNIEL